MLAKLTSKNQITLPEAVIAKVDATEYFEVAVENGRIVLIPVRFRRRRLSGRSWNSSESLNWM